MSWDAIRLVLLRRQLTLVQEEALKTNKADTSQRPWEELRRQEEMAGVYSKAGSPHSCSLHRAAQLAGPPMNAGKAIAPTQPFWMLKWCVAVEA